MPVVRDDADAVGMATVTSIAMASKLLLMMRNDVASGASSVRVCQTRMH